MPLISESALKIFFSVRGVDSYINLDSMQKESGSHKQLFFAAIISLGVTIVFEKIRDQSRLLEKAATLISRAITIL